MDETEVITFKEEKNDVAMMACLPQSHCAVLLIFIIELFGTCPYMTHPIELTAANVFQNLHTIWYTLYAIQ